MLLVTKCYRSVTSMSGGKDRGVFSAHDAGPKLGWDAGVMSSWMTRRERRSLARSLSLGLSGLRLDWRARAFGGRRQDWRRRLPPSCPRPTPRALKLAMAPADAGHPIDFETLLPSSQRPTSSSPVPSVPMTWHFSPSGRRRVFASLSGIAAALVQRHVLR